MKTRRKKRNNFSSPIVSLKDKQLYYFIFGIPLLLFLFMTYIHFSSFKAGFLWLILHPREAFANYIIGFSIINVLLLLSRTKLYLFFSTLSVFVLLIIAYISRIKTDLRGEPLSIFDFRLVEEAMKISEALDTRYYITIIVLTTIFSFILLTITLFVKGAFITKLQFSMAIFCASIIFFSYKMNVNALAKMNIEIPADVSWNHNRNGFLLATLIDTKFLQVPTPKEYSKESVENIYKKMQKNNASFGYETKVKPNVVVILSESFWDPTFAKMLKLNEDPIPNFHRLTKESASGIINVPGIGGGTANTEYEVLTGLTRHFVPNYTVPYNPYNDYIYRPIRSLATIFSEQNYKTTAIHTYHSWFYRRNDVYKNLGFDKFISLETLGNEPEKKCLFAEDRTVSDLIINQLNQSSKKDFILAVTMQGHGPYQDMTALTDRIKIENNISSEAQKITEAYFNNLSTIDEELGHLINRLRQVKEPTMLIFFGDHIPPFGDAVFKEIGFDVTKEKAKETPAFVWSNYEKSTDSFHFHANMLGAYALNKAGIYSDSFMNYLYKYSELSQQISPTIQSDFYHDFEMLQYDLMHGKQYFYELSKKPKVTKTYMLGEPAILKKVTAKETADHYTFDIIGEGIGWMSKLSLNGKEYAMKVMNGENSTVTIPKAGIPKGKLTFVIKTKDSRDKIVKQTNICEYNDIHEMLHQNNISSI